MKDGADAELMRIMDDNEHFTIERLPKNCQATHVVRREGQESVLPIKLLSESDNNEYWHLTDSKFRGILLLWFRNDDALCLDSNAVNVCKTRTSTLRIKYKNDFVHKKNAKSCFAKLYAEHCRSFEEVSNETKYKVIPRSETLLRPSTNQLEADAIDELQVILEGDDMLLTPEKCKADAGFHLGDQTKCLPIQIKSCTFKKDGKTLNLFHNTSGYDEMLLFCRPMRRVYIGTVVMPGNLAPERLSFCTSQGSKYMPYLVPDAQLHQFMCDLYTAVGEEKKEFLWPSGKWFDISNITLNNFVHFCDAVNVTDQVERRSYNKRLAILYNLNYEFPKCQGTTVDVIINGVRVQDKHASCPDDRFGFPVVLSKNAGRMTKSRTAFEANDFDALFVFLPDEEHFSLIPNTVLSEHKMFKSKSESGKKAIVCYLNDYKFAGKGRPPSFEWTKSFCFGWNDPNLNEKVSNFLHTCHRQDLN